MVYSKKIFELYKQQKFSEVTMNCMKLRCMLPIYWIYCTANFYKFRILILYWKPVIRCWCKQFLIPIKMATTSALMHHKWCRVLSISFQYLSTKSVDASSINLTINLRILIGRVPIPFPSSFFVSNPTLQFSNPIPIFDF